MNKRQAEIGVDDDVVTTVSGRLVHFLDPRPGEIVISDIAHSLAHQCRFTGHTRVHYSVAQHSCFVAYRAQSYYKAEALMHDAAEAYLGDLASPIKRLIPQFRYIESDLKRYIFRKYGLHSVYDDEIKKLDIVALVTEGRDLIDHWAHQTSFGVAPDPDMLTPWTAAEAKSEFLFMFETLVACE